MTCDEDAGSGGQFHPVQRALASSKIRTDKLVWRDIEQESTENRHEGVEKSLAGNMNNGKK